ncbi:MAG: fibronectin type III domain-containing protein, partial [Pseudomonadota bacterium]|nr:fibronectin type III domain-containing protein [Pseudomonadota bacterium]
PDTKLGLRTFAFESPEPTNDGRVQSDFPAGSYAFSAISASGAKLEGKAVLNHTFPEPTALVRPQAEAKNVPIKGLQVSWKRVQGADAYMVVIEQESSGRWLKVNLAGNATSFTVPDGFLLPGTEYKLGIGTVAKDGNSSFIETTFNTAKK